MCEIALQLVIKDWEDREHFGIEEEVFWDIISRGDSFETWEKEMIINVYIFEWWVWMGIETMRSII